MERYTLHLSEGEKPGMDYMRRGNVILVKSVRESSAAGSVGVPPGCVVHYINQQRVDGVESLAAALREVETMLVLDVEPEGGSERVIETTVVTPKGPQQAMLSVYPNVLRVHYEGNTTDTPLEALSYVTLLTVPPSLDVTCIHLSSGDQILFANVNSDHLLATINGSLLEKSLPPLEVLDQTEGSRTVSASVTTERSLPDMPHHPLLHNIKTIDMMYVCNMEAVAKIKIAGHTPGVAAEELPDVFAGIKPVLARRGGALVYYVASCKEGIVAIGTQAIYRWVPQSSGTVLARSISIPLISELVQGAGGLVGLHVPTEHDEMLTLPPSGAECWLSSLCEVFVNEAGYPLPVRRVGSVQPERFAEKLWLEPQLGWHAKDPIQLTYQRDLVVPTHAPDMFSALMQSTPAPAQRMVSNDTPVTTPQHAPLVQHANIHTVSPVVNDSFEQRLSSNGSTGQRMATMQLRAKQNEVASLRSLLAMQQDGVGVQHGVQGEFVSNEKEHLKHQVGVLSKQLKDMVEELHVLKDTQQAPPVPIAIPVAMPVPSPPPLAKLTTAEDEVELNQRITALEALIAQSSGSLPDLDVQSVASSGRRAGHRPPAR